MSGIAAAKPAEDARLAAAVDLVINVTGRPITQGSKTRTRYGLRDDNAATLKPWRDNVRSAALDALAGAIHPFGDTGVAVEITYRFERPRHHYRTGRNAHLLRDGAPRHPVAARSGDIDKLQRAVFDSLTEAGAWRDDAQVVDVRAIKTWCQPGQLPGAHIVVRRAEP